MEKAEQVIAELKTLTSEQLDELIYLFHKEKANQILSVQERNKTCAR